MSDPRILAVDPGSTSLGLYDGKHSLTLEAKGKRPERLASLAGDFLMAMQDHGPYDFVVYEEQFVRGGAATKALFGIVGIIEALSVNHFAGVMSVPQSTLRKWAAQVSDWGPVKRGDEKELMGRIASEVALRGFARASTEHERDAACLWYYIREKGTINNG